MASHIAVRVKRNTIQTLEFRVYQSTVCCPCRVGIGCRLDTSRHVLGGVFLCSWVKLLLDFAGWLFSQFSFCMSLESLKNSGLSRIAALCLFFCLKRPDLEIDMVWRNRAFFSFSVSPSVVSSLKDSDRISSERVLLSSFFDEVFLLQNLSHDMFLLFRVYHR